MTFYHPKYYKELRSRNTDQAISPTRATAPSRRATGPGHKLQALEDSTVNRVAEPQASSAKLLKKQATSVKPQAASVKLEAASIKLLDPGPSKKFQAP